MDIILDPQTIVEWDEGERLHALQTSKKHRDYMIQYSHDKITRERLRINESRKEENRTDQWFSGQSVMRRNPKPSGMGTEFWFRPYMVHSVAENGSVGIKLPDGQTIPVYYRNITYLLLIFLISKEDKYI